MRVNRSTYLGGRALLTSLAPPTSWTIDHFLLTKPKLQEAELMEMKTKVRSLHRIIRTKFCHEGSPSCLPFVVLKLLRDFEQVLRSLFCKEVKVR